MSSPVSVVMDVFKAGCPLGALALCFVSASAVAQVSRQAAYWKPVGKPSKHAMVLIIGGHNFGIRGGYDAGSSPPNVEAYRAPNGDIYGSTQQENFGGAYMTSDVQGFALHKQKLKRFPNVSLIDHAGDYALFLPALEGMDPQGAGCAHATLYCTGRTADVGWVRRAKLYRDGTVTGWYPVVGGKPFQEVFHGDDSPAQSPGAPNERIFFEKRYFGFKNGRRIESWQPISKVDLVSRR